jgi:hypothetical protein
MLQLLAGGITVAVLRILDARSGPFTCCELEQEHGMPDVFYLTLSLLCMPAGFLKEAKQIEQ